MEIKALSTWMALFVAKPVFTTSWFQMATA
jgi:hypothetical protein